MTVSKLENLTREKMKTEIAEHLENSDGSER